MGSTCCTPTKSSEVIYEAKWTVGLEPFAFSQFDESAEADTKIPYDKNAFITKVNALINDKTEFIEGYAPFCKHIIIENFTDAKTPCIEITDENRHLIVTEYVARRDNELPVLVRYIPASKLPEQPKAKYLDLILYSKEQCIKEAEAMNSPPPPADAPEWLCIFIKPQNEPFETPMDPITMFRNSMISEGGSDVPVDKDAYLKSVQFWKTHVDVHQ